MKVLMLNTWDISGGAARAANRLHKGVRAAGIASSMLVRDKAGNDKDIKTVYSKPGGNMRDRIRPHIERLPLKLYRNRRKTPFHVQWTTAVKPSDISLYNPDIIHLHWICGGFASIELLSKLHKPLVWTFHDMWAFSGGCNYSWDCKRYKDACGKCPQLGSSRNNDLSRRIWQRKKKKWGDLDLTVVTPSLWMAQCARESSLFKHMRVEVIPNGIDTQLFKPRDKPVARNLLKLPKEKKLILFGALSSTSDPTKGFQHLKAAFRELQYHEQASQIEVVVFGSPKPDPEPDFGLPVSWLGRYHNDAELAMVYSASDVFVAPSEQDNLPNTVMEAMACGTPCVVFNIGGMPDMIDHKRNGYISAPFKTDDLAEGIVWILEDGKRREMLSKNAREKVINEYMIETIAQKYIKLYNKLN